MAKRRVRRGTKQGYAVTTFRSPRIVRFGVEILGDLPQAGAAGNELIMAKAFGPAIDAVGGVPFGASGSPVYVGGKLIGAISAVLSSDFRHVGITPLSAILALQKEPQVQLEDLSGGDTNLAHCALPVSTGFRSTKVAEQLRQRFGKDLYISPTRARAGRGKSIGPGSPVGVALLTGDLKLGYIGSVTKVTEGQVFAFGHPLLFAGQVRFPLTEATVLATGGGSYPAKIGVLGETIGTVLQDRAAGVYGLLSTPPEYMVGLDLTVHEGNRLVTERVKVQAVPYFSELPFLVYVATLETVVRAMNRVGGGEAAWTWRVHFFEGEPLEVSNQIYDPFDISYAIAVSVFALMEEALGQGRLVRCIELEANVKL